MQPHLHLDDLVLQLRLVLQSLHHVVKVHGAHESAELEQLLVGLVERIQNDRSIILTVTLSADLLNNRPKFTLEGRIGA